jgi:ADP-heptose:LPS heptosyltransferase
MDVIAIRSGALGDFVATLPVLSRLREEGRLTLVADPRYRTLFEADRWIDIHGPEATALFSGAPQRADVGVAWTTTGAEVLEACGVRWVLRGRPRPDLGVSIHDHLWEPIRGWLGARDRDPRVPRNSMAEQAISVRVSGSPVVIAPGSGGSTKRWPLERWREVAAAVVARSRDGVVWVGGPVEADESGWGEPYLGDLDLRGLAALASQCRCWLGPDAGPGHLAAAVGARVGVVFVCTDPRSWAPPSARVFAAEDQASALVDFALAVP